MLLTVSYDLQLRMQHEVYPEDQKQSTRFVLLVREIELVDRLAASQLNKFLSQYVSNTIYMPKQTHANMVRIHEAFVEQDNILRI